MELKTKTMTVRRNLLVPQKQKTNENLSHQDYPFKSDCPPSVLHNGLPKTSKTPQAQISLYAEMLTETVPGLTA